MRRYVRNSLIAAVVALSAAWVAYQVAGENGLFNTEVWVREAPLAEAVAVSKVENGTITLSDGRSLRPAGVARRDGVSVEEFDAAIRTAVAQGVAVTRDLGDGRAFLRAEPRFYNWCGTRGYQGNPWAHWAGSYLQMPLSELLIHAGYAKANLDEEGLAGRERWRLGGVQHIAAGINESPVRISTESTAFRYDGSERYLSTDCDEWVESLWKPPPE